MSGHFPTARGDSEAVRSNRAFELRMTVANKNLDRLIEEYRHTFGKGSLNSPMMADARRHLIATQGPQGLEDFCKFIQHRIATRSPIAMDFWESLE